MPREVVLFSLPRSVGGGCSEAAHTALLWRSLGIGVTILPSRPVDPQDGWAARLVAAGCRFTDPCHPDRIPGWLRDKTVVDFACETAVRHWPAMRAAGCRLIHVPCHSDFHLPHESQVFPECPPTAAMFQSKYQTGQLGWQYSLWGLPWDRMFTIHGAFDPSGFPFCPRPHMPREPFIVGSCGRAVPAKWESWTVPILSTARVAIPLEARWLGWTEKVIAFSGQPPAWVQTFPPGSVSTRDFLAGCHCLLCVPGCRENWSRVCLEAMASGVPVVAWKRGGFPEMIEDRVTGVLGTSTDEISASLLWLAVEENYRLEMARNARESLRTLTDPEAIGHKWRELFAAVENLADQD